MFKRIKITWSIQLVVFKLKSVGNRVLICLVANTFPTLDLTIIQYPIIAWYSPLVQYLKTVKTVTQRKSFVMVFAEESWKVNLMTTLLSSYRMLYLNIVVKPFVMMKLTAYITPITEKTMITILTFVSSCLISKRLSKNVNTVWHLYRTVRTALMPASSQLTTRTLSIIHMRSPALTTLFNFHWHQTTVVQPTNRVGTLGYDLVWHLSGAWQKTSYGSYS